VRLILKNAFLLPSRHSHSRNGVASLAYPQRVVARGWGWGWGDIVSSPPTPAHFTDVKFADPPLRCAGGGNRTARHGIAINLRWP
jgi:hypothetical protein